MAKFRKNSYGGERPISTNTPIMVVGGFNLDPSISIPQGETIPAGTLSAFDESTRLVKIQKTAKVKSINSTNSKEITLESNLFFNPIFVVGDKVVKTVSGTYASAPTINKIEFESAGSYVITLSAAITGLAVGDIISHVISDASDNAALVIPAPYAITVTESEESESTSDNELGVDVTINSGSGSFYARRIPPIPADMLGTGGIFLKYNPNITFTNSK